MRARFVRVPGLRVRSTTAAQERDLRVTNPKVTLTDRVASRRELVGAHESFWTVAGPGPHQVPSLSWWTRSNTPDSTRHFSAHRYLCDGADDLVAGIHQSGTIQARIVVRPTWVGLLDSAERLPSPLVGV